MSKFTPVDPATPSVPAQIVFRGDSVFENDGTERMTFVARLLSRRVIDRGLHTGRAYEVAASDAGQRGVVAVIDVTVTPDGETTARGWIQGGSRGGRRYNLYATGQRAIAEAQEHAIRWAARRFRVAL